MDATLERIDNTVIDAYVERCSRFAENVQKLQQQIQDFKSQFFGDVSEQQVAQENTFDAHPIVESASTISPQPSTSDTIVTIDDIDIDALLNDIITDTDDLEM